MRTLLLDTDIGSDVDDHLALALALLDPELDLAAVTTLGSDPVRGAAMARRVLELAGRGEVPVHAGEARALLRRERFGPIRLGDPEEPLRAGPSPEPAPEAIARLAAERPGLELVAIGPLTNLARALALDPELPRRVAGLTVMGGHIRDVRIGSVSMRPGIDYNLCADPEATVAVLGAGFPTTLVTADVTLRVWIREEEVERLARAGPLGRHLALQVRRWTPEQRRIFTGLGGELAPDNAAFLHDPLTVAALVGPAGLRFEEIGVLPTVAEGILRTLESPLGPRMRVATEVDPEAARDAILRRLLP